MPAIVRAGDGASEPRVTAVSGQLDPHRTTATLAIRYELALPGDAERVGIALDVPRGGVVTGATVHAGRVTRALALQPATAVADLLDRFRDGTGPGAWLFAIASEDDGRVAFSVGVPEPTRITLDLAVTAPTCFFRDTRYVAVPAAWRFHVVHPRFVKAAPEACTGDRDRADEIWLQFPDHTLVGVPEGAPRIGAIADQLALADTNVARLELDLADQLADIPADLATVLLVDNSRSLDENMRHEQARLVASYLAEAAGTRVQVIAYDRRAHALLPAWQTAADARPAIVAAIGGLVPVNGTNFDVALAEARHWLDGTRGTKRIIAFTDEQLPQRISVDALAVPPGVLVHAVALRGNVGLLARDDDSLLADFAARTEGVGFATADYGDGAAVLVRPRALEQLEVSGADWTELGDADCQGTLGHGESCAWLATGSGAIHVSGLLWNHPIARDLAPSAAHAIELARTLTLDATVPPAFRPEVARLARAVDSVWSLAASWGRGGYHDVSMSGMTGGSSVGIVDRAGVVGHSITRPPSESLAAQLARAVAPCGATHGLSADVELTDDEIVDVQLTGAGSGALATCATEAVWATPVRAAGAGHRTEHVDL